MDVLCFDPFLLRTVFYLFHLIVDPGSFPLNEAPHIYLVLQDPENLYRLPLRTAGAFESAVIINAA